MTRWPLIYGIAFVLLVAAIFWAPWPSSLGLDPAPQPECITPP